MNTATRVLRNVMLLLSSSVLTFFISFVFNIYSARYLGPSNFGIISFAIAFCWSIWDMF